MITGLYPIVGDVLHAGHMLAMEEAKNNCGRLVVALNCSPEGKNPIQSVYERFIQLKAIKYVDEVLVYGGKKDLELIALSYDYDIRFVGDDYRGREWDGKNIERSLNKEWYFLSRKHYLSSTELKGRIKGNESSK